MKVGIQRHLLLAALLLVAIGVWSIPLLRAHEAGDGPVRGRPDLQICVQRVDGQPLPSQAMSKIRAALTTVRQHPHFQAAKLDSGGGPKLIPGCPQQPTLRDKHWHDNITTMPSPIYTFIFITSETDLEGVAFKGFPRVVPQELACRIDEAGGACNEITKAVYITFQEIDDEATLIRALTAGVGLRLLDQGPTNPIYTDGVTRGRSMPQDGTAVPAPTPTP